LSHHNSGGPEALLRPRGCALFRANSAAGRKLLNYGYGQYTEDCHADQKLDQGKTFVCHIQSFFSHTFTPSD
jgi:hypothetical protein